MHFNIDVTNNKLWQVIVSVWVIIMWVYVINSSVWLNGIIFSGKNDLTFKYSLNFNKMLYI
jgi:hypothetical protein